MKGKPLKNNAKHENELAKKRFCKQVTLEGSHKKKYIDKVHAK
jgi:hypothetical protein